MVKKLITLKVDEMEHVVWQNLAKEAGLNVSEWIRAKCSGGGVVEKSDNKAVRAVADSSVLPRGVVSGGGLCGHDYGIKACPFPGCRNYKWEGK